MSKAHREAIQHLFDGDADGVSWRQVVVTMAQHHPTSFNRIMRLRKETPWVREVLGRPTKVEAIKAHRVHNNSTLKEAKEWVDKHWRRRHV